MNRLVRIGRAEVPGAGVMDLFQDGRSFSIHVDGRELMHSAVHGSEDALADLAFDRITIRSGCRALVGGLGMGFTLAAALRRVPEDGEVVLAELVPEIIAWHRGPLGVVAGHPLDDPRTTVRNEDVAVVLADSPGGFDVIALDVDNGPRGLTTPGNDGLYAWEGLRTAGRALRPGGILAYWSAAPDAAFTRRFAKAGFEVEEVEVRSRGAAGGHRHTLWFGRPK